MIFTAHISHDRKREQSTVEHCINTSKLCAEYCSLFGAENIGRAAGLLHDAGKLCGDFESYIRNESEFKRGDIDHSYAGARYIMDIADKESAGAARLIARVIISHHGLHDWVDDKYRDYFNMRISNDKNYEEISSNITRIASEGEICILLEKAADEYRGLRNEISKISKSEEDYSFYLGMLERMIESALIDADRSDTASFMNDSAVAEYNADKSLWLSMKRNMEQRLDAFSDRTDDISVRRQSISDRCAAHAVNDVRICRMIVPTGGGKTLSSMRFAVEYCIAHDMQKIIYTAPFMSILEQNSDELSRIAGADNFIEHHSNALAETDDTAEEYKDYELHTERWDKPVIATTMLQVLNAMFLGKTSSVRRFHRLAKSVLIIDEVQSLPLKCVNMFDLAVNFLAYICGTAVVLCTATQPVTENVRFPMLIDSAESLTGDYSTDFDVFKRTQIIASVDPYGRSFEETADFCIDRFSEAGDLLVIVNTKSSALKLYGLMRDKCGNCAEVIHLSTNMCPQHRRDGIKRIRSLLDGKKPVICVTTQLIEAGVDISFRCVVRSLAGLDSAVQAAGRCNRHGENDKLCPVYLIKIKEEKLGGLKEIAVSQNITQHMLDKGGYTDLSSPDAVSEYFRLFYREEKGHLSYSVADHETLLNYLSLNKNRYDVSPKTSSKRESQAFKTAGTLFRVIDNNTQDVIVPYNDEAEALIMRLERPFENTALLLRKAQKYMVSIYSGTERKLYEKNALHKLESGAVVLDKAYYSDEYGVDIEGACEELLIF